MTKLISIFIVVLFSNLLCLFLGDNLTALAADELFLGTLHAANLYISQPTHSNLTTNPTPLNGKNQLITSNCSFFDVDPELLRSLNSFKSEEDKANAPSPDSTAIREATKLVKLFHILLPGVSKEDLDLLNKLSNITNRDRLHHKVDEKDDDTISDEDWMDFHKSVILSGLVHAGPFVGENARGDSSAAPTRRGPPEGELNAPLVISFFAGENTGKLCFDLSLHDAMANVSDLRSALTVVSSPHCTTRVDELVEKELAMDQPEISFYDLSNGSPEDHNVEEDPAESSWLKACELSSVVRFDHRFTLSTALAGEKLLCKYMDEPEGSGQVSPSLEGQRRAIYCSFKVAVRFRPFMKHLSLKEKTQAVLKIAAVVTMPPAEAETDDQSGLFFTHLIQPEGGASTQRSTLPRESQKTHLYNLNRFSVLSEGEEKEASLVQRCSDVSLSDQFWNLSGPSCTPSLGVNYRSVIRYYVNDNLDKIQLCVVFLFIFWLTVVSVIGTRFFFDKCRKNRLPL
ncbi:unnamed protein product [Phytomonas sp. Hart1]|nr:unnamed protein product [Phytomonas sp. Hart1]|eukprot:CCW68934.1 unnamed protein product [Phytomonas sp. isolate Hart1]